MFHNKQTTSDSPVLFLYSMSYEVMTLFPSNLCVQRRFMLRSLTSRTSNSGGSGGSEDEWTPRHKPQMKRMGGEGCTCARQANMRRSRRVMHSGGRGHLEQWAEWGLVLLHKSWWRDRRRRQSPHALLASAVWGKVERELSKWAAPLFLGCEN